MEKPSARKRLHMHSSEMHEYCMIIWESGLGNPFTFTFGPETTGWIGGAAIVTNLIVNVQDAGITGHYFCIHGAVMNVIK